MHRITLRVYVLFPCTHALMHSNLQWAVMAARECSTCSLTFVCLAVCFEPTRPIAWCMWLHIGSMYVCI